VFFKFRFWGVWGAAAGQPPLWVCPFFQRLYKRLKLERVQHIMNVQSEDASIVWNMTPVTGIFPDTNVRVKLVSQNHQKNLL